MPGINLNLTLPANDQTMSVNMARITTALSAIQDDLAGKVVVAELDINDAVDFQGNSARNVRGLYLTTGVDGSAPPGTLFYSGGELHVVTPAGTVDITLNGAINASSIGGFTGLTGTASAVYDVASTQFRFFESPGTYATLVSEDIVLQGTNGSVRLGVDDALTGTRVAKFASLPSSGVSLLAYKASTSTVIDASTATIDHDLMTSGAFTCSGLATLAVTTATTFTASTAIKHTFERALPISMCDAVGGAGVTVAPCNLSSTSTATAYIPVDLEVGDRLKRVVIRNKKSTSTTTTFRLFRYDQDGTLTQTTTVTDSLGTGVVRTNTLTVSGPVVIAAGDTYVVQVDFGGGTTDQVMSAVKFWDRP